MQIGHLYAYVATYFTRKNNYNINFNILSRILLHSCILCMYFISPYLY